MEITDFVKKRPTERVQPAVPEQVSSRWAACAALHMHGQFPAPPRILVSVSETRVSKLISQVASSLLALEAAAGGMQPSCSCLNIQRGKREGRRELVFLLVNFWK